MKFIGSIITRITTNFNSCFSLEKPSPQPLSQGEGRVQLEQIRSQVNNFFFVLIFILSVLIAFFMGRTYKFMENRPAFYFESLEQEQKYQQQIVSEEKEKLFSKFQKDGGGGTAAQNKMIVASKGGKKYYFVWCSGAGNIKEANKRYFADEAAAEKAGYTKAASCK